jgi:tripartite-type tricarboxylate transporter receptor subunit TctC
LGNFLFSSFGVKTSGYYHNLFGKEKKMKRMGLPALCLIALFLSNSPCGALDYPTRPITIINPNPPGGGDDVFARAFAPFAEKELGQPVIVINKPGATGMIGRVAAAQAFPDGYTLGICSTGMTCNVEWEIANGRKPPINRDDFIVIGTHTRSPTLVVVGYDSPWKMVADIQRDCKARPNHYAFSSAGLFGDSHIGTEILVKALGIKCRHVPYKGGGPALSAVVGGHVDFATQFPATSIPLAKGNKLRILAVQGSQRLKSIPDIPTIKECGVDAEWTSWRGFVVPLKTPMAIVEKLRNVTLKVVNSPSFIEAIEKMGDEVHPIIGDDLARYWDLEAATVAKLMQELVKESK